MYDAASLSELHQRARGAVHVSFKRRGDATVLDNLRQEGCLKARFPNAERGAWTSGVLINSSGGVAAGDFLAVAIEAGAGCAASLATQAAERIYRALPGAAPATLRTRLTVAAGASLEWLPQETILFDHAALDRTLEVHLAEDSVFTGLETLVLGRTEMGEGVSRARVTDRIRLHRDGRLILHDAIRLHGDLTARLGSRSTAAGGKAVATLLHVAPDAAGKRDDLRAALAEWDAGASFWDGMLVARIVAAEMATARQAVLAGLGVLRGGRPVPRVWQL